MSAEQGSAAGSVISASGSRSCPACGEPLYGWAVIESDGDSRAAREVLDRCEECGLGIAHETSDVNLAPDAQGRLTAPNRRSWQAGIGGEHWAPLELESTDAYLTPKALGLLLDGAGYELLVLRQPALGANQLWMWQTLLNAFTFHDGFAIRVLRGRLGLRNARSAPAFVVDLVVSVLAALPLAVAALPLELVAVVVRRGGLLEAEVRRLRA